MLKIKARIDISDSQGLMFKQGNVYYPENVEGHDYEYLVKDEFGVERLVSGDTYKPKI